MSAKNTIKIIGFGLWITLQTSSALSAPLNTTHSPLTPLTQQEIADHLGWVVDTNDECGGYYLEQPFEFPLADENRRNTVKITGKQGLFTKRGTSDIEGVTITRSGQQITANNGYLYRDPKTYKLVSMEMIGNVHLREPNTLILGRRARYNFETTSKSLLDIIYRTALHGKQPVGPSVPKQELKQTRRVNETTAWGVADEASQTEPKIYELNGASYSTCPPLSPAWRVKGSHLVLNKNTGRGYVTNARLYLKSVPIFYFPYISFPIDRQRKSGFLWPTIGVGSGQNKWGPYFFAPYYWNMAPNYDMIVTPGIITKRGFQLKDHFRYLTTRSEGDLDFAILPDDKEFEILKETYQNEFAGAGEPISAELNRLLNSSNTRKSVAWHDNTQFNPYWSSHIDFSYAGDDYYLQDFGSNLDETTENQLLQEADLYYKGQNWDFTGRLQTYQTLHPIIEGQPSVTNQYRRFPQLILNGDYPNQKFGLEYFVNMDMTHFDIRNTPGTPVNLPLGNRMHLQPGVSLPLYWPFFYINPRAQIALTDYQLYQIAETNAPGGVHRGIPIFDVASGLNFSRDVSWIGHWYQQTLEPQAYYTYIPYRNQASIPVFDTTVNTLTYDQLFNYNRFTGIDRIGDANQLGLGVTTRLIDQTTGLEQMRLGMGGIVYFANRLVTLCNDNSCTDNPDNHSNFQRLSPLSGLLEYHVNPHWNLTANSIWNPVTKQMGNATVQIQYHPAELKVINLSYGYVFNGDINSGSVVNTAQNNLKITDFSFAWPVTERFSAVGRWSEDWSFTHLQNLVYGLQYDSCCWAVRLVGGKTLTQLQNQTPEYSNQIFIQFSLKGLGNIGSGDPTNFLSKISGYETHFGQEI